VLWEILIVFRCGIHRGAVAPVVAAAPRQPSVIRENQQLTFGLIVVVAGFVAIMIGLWLVVINYPAAADATAVLGIVTTAIGTRPRDRRTTSTTGSIGSTSASWSRNDRSFTFAA
jgi:hypothetical protein